MKLSQIKDADAIDVLAEIIVPAQRMLADKKFAEMYRSNTPYVLIVQYLLREHKQSVLEILASMNRKTVADYHFNIITLTRDLLELLNDEELVTVFQSQGQKKQDGSFGSATEDIPETEVK